MTIPSNETVDQLVLGHLDDADLPDAAHDLVLGFRRRRGGPDRPHRLVRTVQGDAPPHLRVGADHRGTAGMARGRHVSATPTRSGRENLTLTAVAVL